MILISHRGNLNGSNPTRENNPDYIINILGFGFDCEIDIRFVNGEFWLGHDEPLYKIKQKFLMNEKLWLHCKDLPSLFMLKDIHPNVFYHTHEDFVLTSGGKIWTFPGKALTNNSIFVLPEQVLPTINTLTKNNLPPCYGVCSDFIQQF